MSILWLRKKLFERRNLPKEAGFSVVELLVIIVIIGLLSVLIFMDYESTRATLSEIDGAHMFLAEIRNAQSKSLSGVTHNSLVKCGYGIRYENSTQFSMYAGEDGGGLCGDQNRNYQSGIDTIVKTFEFKDDTIEFELPFKDLFYESPNAEHFANDDRDTAMRAVVRKIGVDCDVIDCIEIIAWPSGAVDLTTALYHGSPPAPLP